MKTTTVLTLVQVRSEILTANQKYLKFFEKKLYQCARAKFILQTSHYRVYRNWTRDVQHDFVEGGTQNNVKLVLLHLIVNRAEISI